MGLTSYYLYMGTMLFLIVALLAFGASMLLAWLARRAQDDRYLKGAQAIEQAMQHCIAERQVTRDIGGTLGTRATGAALIKALEQV